MKLFDKQFIYKQNGIAAMMSVVIVGAAALLMTFTASIVALGDLEQSFVAQQGAEAFSVTDGCMEEALRRLRLDDQYAVSATENLTLSNGSCTIDVTDLGSNQRRVIVVGTVEDYNKKIQVELTLTGNVITIDDWQELSS